MRFILVPLGTRTRFVVCYIVIINGNYLLLMLASAFSKLIIDSFWNEQFRAVQIALNIKSHLALLQYGLNT